MNKLIKKGFLALTLFSCITMVGCVGEQGPAGPQGEPGIQGEPGHTPNIAIGENGNWFIDGVDTGVKAEGKDGEPGPVGPEGPAGPQGPAGTGSGSNEVTQSKVVDLVMFMGQSNMAGRGVAAESTVVNPGEGYEFRAMSDPSKLYDVEEPFGKKENNSSSGVNESTKTGSMVSSFIHEYYKRTKTPIVGVSCSKGGTKIEWWKPGSAPLNDAINRHKLAKDWLLENGYTIRNDFMVWCQGESDGDNGVSKDAYVQGLDNMIQEMKKNGIEKAFIVRIGNHRNNATIYDNIILGQTEYCRESEDAVLVSTKLAGFAKEGLMKDAFHYTQEGYNIVGKDAGMNTAFYINNGLEPYMYDSEYDNVYFPYKELNTGSNENDNQGGTIVTPEPEYVEKKVEFSFDSTTENGIDLSSAGVVSDGKITVDGKCAGLQLTNPITISRNESFTIEATVKTGAGGVLLSTGDSTGGFLNIPSNNDDASTNGFTLRDPSGTNSMFFKKDISKLGEKKHLAMVYDKTAGTLKAYEDGVEMEFKAQKGSWEKFADTTFIKMFGGFSSSYQFQGELYHFKYINKALNSNEFTIEKDNVLEEEKVLEFNFDSNNENGYDFSKNGTIENGMLKVTTKSAHTLKEPITITNRNSFSIELTVRTYAAGNGGTGDIILQTAKGNTSAGFLNIPSGNNDASGNGFTLRDQDRSFNRLFMKDTNKLGQKTHLAMVYDADSKTLKAYQDGVEMKIQTGQNTGDIDTMKDMTFITFLSGFSGDLYHFRYINRALAVSEFKTNQ